MDDLLTVKQLSIILKVHQLTIRRYINEGKLKAVKVGGNVRVPQESLRSFMENYASSSKSTKSTTSSSEEPFTPSDSLFRLKGRGLSLENVNR
jgi:excisionase family DNA binding protein